MKDGNLPIKFSSQKFIWIPRKIVLVSVIMYPKGKVRNGYVRYSAEFTSKMSWHNIASLHNRNKGLFNNSDINA